MSKENRAAIYIRVSTQMQAEEGFSMEAQQDILMDVIKRKELQFFRAYSDPGISGGSFKRPGIQALIADMKAKRFDTILVHKLDRLSRNLGDLHSFIDVLNKLDVRLIIAAQGNDEIDTRSPMGKAFIYFSGIWGQIYLENLREETLKGLITKTQKGGAHRSRAPLGYELDGEGSLHINELEAELVREVFQMYLKGVGRNKIAQHMNTHSRLKEGGKWDAKAVITLVSNPTYAGYNHFKPDHWEESRRIIREGTHEALVSRQDFEKVQEYINRRTNGHMSKNSYMYAYSGIVRCSKCGGNYTGNTTKQKMADGSLKAYKAYRCHNNYLHKTCNAPGIQETRLTEIIFERLVMENEGLQDKTVNKKESSINLNKEVETSTRRKKNWMMALGDGNLSSDDYATLMDEEDERMNIIYARVREEQMVNESEIPTEELIGALMNIRNNWEMLEEDTQKAVIQNLFRKITIRKSATWEVTELLTV